MVVGCVGWSQICLAVVVGVALSLASVVVVGR